MNRLSRAVIAVVLLAGALWSGGVAEAGRMPSAVTVCVNASSGMVRLVASSSECVGGAQSWSASQSAPLLCWNASSLDPQVGTRKVSVAPSSGCAAPLRSVPVGEVLLLCAGGKFGVLRWPVTGSCRSGVTPIWVHSAATPITSATSATSATSTTSTTSTTAVVVPSVSLLATSIEGNTWPRAVTVTANVVGTIYFAEGDFIVKTVSDITSVPSYRWASGTVTSANAPTSIPIDVDALTNGYYRVFVADSKGVLSAPAINIVTISVTRASTATTVAVRTQTLDQSNPTWHIGRWNTGVSSSQSIGQSFKAGKTGPLSRISVGITSQRTVTLITAAIYATIPGTNTATGSALASKTIDGTTVPTTHGGALTVFDFASPVSVTAGTKYVIVLTTPDFYNSMSRSGGDYSWFELDGNGYGDGNGIAFPLTSPSVLNDYVFQTYVDI